MTQKQVIAMLREHRGRVGRCGHIDAEILRLQRAIRAARAQYEFDLAAPPMSRLDGMPRSGFSGSPTERAAMAMADERRFEESEAREIIRRLEVEIARLQAEREELALWIQYVDSWLAGLPDQERWVIERHLVDGEIWHEISLQYRDRFCDDISRDRLKRMQQRALDRIWAMVS